MSLPSVNHSFPVTPVRRRQLLGWIVGSATVHLALFYTLVLLPGAEKAPLTLQKSTLAVTVEITSRSTAQTQADSTQPPVSQSVVSTPPPTTNESPNSTAEQPTTENADPSENIPQERPVLATNQANEITTAEAKEKTLQPVKETDIASAPETETETETETEKSITQTAVNPQALSREAVADSVRVEENQHSTTDSGTTAAGNVQTTDTLNEPVDFVPASFRGKPPIVVKPDIAIKRRWRGEVILRGYVNSLGELESVSVFHSSGYEVLDESAIEQALRWSFEPGRVNGIEHPQWIQLPVHFR